MKLVLFALIVGLLINLAFSAVVTHWFPRPNPDRVAWNIAKEAALDKAGLEETRAAQ